MEQSKKSTKKSPKVQKVGNREIGVSDFCSLASLSFREKFWAERKFANTVMTGFEWCDLMISEGALSEVPEIFNLK